MTVIGYSPLEQGRMGTELRKRSRVAETMKQIMEETGKTLAQVLINWAVRNPWAVTIPQTNRVERVDENLGASDWRLTDEQHDLLSAATGR